MPEIEKPVDKVVEPIVDDLDGPEDIIDEDPILDPESVPADPKNKVNPLSPGGMRFEQVYAKGKQAERDRDHEKELRIAAEAKLEALTKGTTSTEKEYGPR